MSKAQLKKVLDNLEKEPKQIHKFYDRVIKLSSNLGNKPFPRKAKTGLFIKQKKNMKKV